ncbi:2-C-methyl-D-erythritol 4-phosphate cytidylyltransferase [Acinetobacter qingfengensis]|nr:2-C-methyl-D-erythritol 4-phosphate cytidylyltransferase [Acinetobacter qingfengensis]KAA8731410.1 2-C-methyl-D-erythritol 4-phosphate cytidylyltransferase [Acinetobacter qingfengensis]
MAIPKLWAVIPAAGSGKRFSTTQLKQYQQLCDKTVLQHSVNALYQLPLAGCVISISTEDRIAKQLVFDHPVQFCLGGQERMDSVLAGLNHLRDYAADDDYVLVHDAARPCLHQTQIQYIIEFCHKDEVAGIIAVPVRDTLKYAEKHQYIAHTVDRENLWQAQTPQIVKYAVLRSALEKAQQKQIVVTDEASALEVLGIAIKLIPGRSDNIKITYAEDLQLAKLILQSF